MRFLKGFLIVLITIIIVGLLSILLTATYLKKTIAEDFLSKVVQEEIGNDMVKIISEELPEILPEQLEQVKKAITSNEEVEEIVTSFTDKFIQDIAKDNIEEIEIKKEIKDLIIANKKIAEKELGEKITNEKIEKALTQIDNSVEFGNLYKEVITETRQELTKEDLEILKAYAWVDSNDFKWIFIGGIILGLLLIAILKKTYYAWLKNLSIAGIISAIITTSSGLGCLLILNIVYEELNLTVKVSTTPLLIISAIALGLGIISLIAYLVIKKNELPKEGTEQF